MWKDLLFLQSSSASGDQRMLLCLDARTGKKIWSRSLPGKKVPGRIHAKSSLASQTPVTDGEAVYASFWDGQDIDLAAYTVKGDPLWKKNLGPWVSEHGAGASPILYKDKVIFFNDMDRLDKEQEPVDPALDAAGPGQEDRRRRLGAAARSVIGLATARRSFVEKPGKAPELIVTSTTAISGINPDNGSENWTWKWTFTAKMPLRTIAASFIADGLLFAFSGDGGGDRQMYAVSVPADGGPRNVWQNKKDFPYVPCCLTNGPNIYFVNDRGFAGCFEAKTGKKIWLERLPEATFSASPVLVDGNVYAPSEQGDRLRLRRRAELQAAGPEQLGETIRATPAVADGRLYIRGQNHLFCIGKK